MQQNKKLEKIYIELPKEEIKTDLLSIYTKLFEIATICSFKKEKTNDKETDNTEPKNKEPE
mgnify:CR=1 FL=1